MSAPTLVEAPTLGTGTASHRRVRHGFFTRQGGVSAGLYSSLNCGFGSGDDRGAVAENRARVADALGGPADGLVTVHQVHGTAVAQVDRPWRPDAAPKADALVTRIPGVVLGILAADCAPVLLADAEAGVIGAAHAGWRGALAGVVEATVAAMEQIGATRARTVAVIGPCIAAASYEVGVDFADRFIAEDTINRRFFTPGRAPDKRQFDLPGYLIGRLAGVGLARVDALGLDTLSDAARWFSYRRSCLAHEPDYGRQISAITLG